MHTHPLPHRPDIVVTDFDGRGTFLIIEVRTFDGLSALRGITVNAGRPTPPCALYFL